MEGQTTIFEMLFPTYKINKKVRMITLFSGYDSQCLAMKYLGVDYEHYKTCEWAVKSIQALKDIHFTDDDTDYSKDLTKEEPKENFQYMVHKMANEDIKIFESLELKDKLIKLQEQEIDKYKIVLDKIKELAKENINNGFMRPEIEETTMTFKNALALDILDLLEEIND